MTDAAHIVPDERAGHVVVLDGHPQSHVNLEDPLDLAFEYVAIMAGLLDALRPGPAPLRVTHVGGAGLTMPRWVHATRPGSPQIVLEPDVALTELVRRELPLPRGHRIRVRPQDGASGVAALAPGSADVVVVDAYAAGRVPAELGALPFLASCARALAPGGLLLMNVADEPASRYAARVAAGARLAFAAGEASGGEGGREEGCAAYVTTADVAKGRRFGNRVLLAAATPLDEYRVRRAVAALPWPCTLVTGRDLERKAPGAQPFTAADAEASPAPPDPGRSWRVR